MAVAAPESDIVNRAEPVLLQNFAAGILTLTLNRPQHYNALSGELLDALQKAFDKAAGDDSIKVLIIAARGKAFCPGHDLREMRSSEDPDFHRALFARCSRMMMSIQHLPQPVIAQVNGIATAAGCQLVAACDLAVASQSARFAVSGIDQGVFCSTPSVALSRAIGRKQALYMLLSGEFIDAETAMQYGLVNKVVAHDELGTATRALAQTICGKSQLAVRTGKKMFYRQLQMPLADAYAYAGETMACNMNSNDAREGIDAFFAKREPRWRDS